MSRRSSPQHLTDDRAFPVRVLLQNPGGFAENLGPRRDPQSWLVEKFGNGNALLWAFRSPFVGDAFALYCRSMPEAVAFLTAFPEFQIADGTVSPVYNAPGIAAGVRLRDLRIVP